MESTNNGKAGVFDALAETVKALANGRRLELVELLAQGEHSVDALARLAGTSVTSTSAHLQVLKRAGLVRTRRDGTTIHYRLAGDDVAELYVLAQRVGLRRSGTLRDAAHEYLDEAGPVPVVPATSAGGAALVVDVRPAREYQDGHLPGAVSIPLADLEHRLADLPTDRPVAVYCRGELCRLAREAALRMRQHGIDAVVLAEGVVEWRASAAVDLDVVA